MIANVDSVQGGWKPNMWGNYPKHMLGKVNQYPAIEWLSTPSARRPELYDRTKKQDPFKSNVDVEELDYENQRLFS